MNDDEKLLDRRQRDRPVDEDRRSGEDRRAEAQPVLRERRFAERVRDRLLPSPTDILDQARREELIPLDLVARATTISARKVLRDWQKRHLPYTKIGRTILLPSRLMLETYFPQQFPRAVDR